MLEDESFYGSLWGRLQSPEPNWLARVGVSLASGLLLVASGFVCGWIAAVQVGWQWSDACYAIGFVASSVLWLLVLILVWRPVRRGRALIVKPVLLTVAVGLATVGGMVLADMLVRYGDEPLMLAVFLLGVAVTILIWLPAIDRMRRGVPVIRSDGQVNVVCPKCNYPMIGLRGTRCPECGAEFTIDELVKAQGYHRVAKDADQHAVSREQDAVNC